MKAELKKRFQKLNQKEKNKIKNYLESESFEFLLDKLKSSENENVKDLRDKILPILKLIYAEELQALENQEADILISRAEENKQKVTRIRKSRRTEWVYNDQDLGRWPHLSDEKKGSLKDCEALPDYLRQIILAGQEDQNE